MKESIGEMVRVTLRRVKFVCGGRSRPVLWGEQTAQSDEPHSKKGITQYPSPTQKRKKNMFHVTISK